MRPCSPSRRCTEPPRSSRSGWPRSCCAPRGAVGCRAEDGPRRGAAPLPTPWPCDRGGDATNGHVRARVPATVRCASDTQTTHALLGAGGAIHRYTSRQPAWAAWASPISPLSARGQPRPPVAEWAGVLRQRAVVPQQRPLRRPLGRPAGSFRDLITPSSARARRARRCQGQARRGLDPLHGARHAARAAHSAC